MTVITVSSNKGGVGKTTTAVTLAAFLATSAPTFLIDFNPQGQCALCLGLDPRGGVFDWLVADQPLSNCMLIAPTAPGLLLIPGNMKNKTVDAFYREKMGGFDLLIGSIRKLQAAWVIIDTAADGYLQEAALAAADHVIVPFECEAMGVDGALTTLKLVEHLARSAKTTLLPTSFDRRIKEHTQGLREMLDEYGTLGVADPIPSRSAVKEASAFGETIWLYKHPGLTDVKVAYRKLIARILAQHDPKEAKEND